jgi:hypothetical protein
MNNLHTLIKVLDHHEMLHGSEPLTISLLKKILQSFDNEVERQARKQEQADDMLENSSNTCKDRDQP